MSDTNQNQGFGAWMGLVFLLLGIGIMIGSYTVSRGLNDLHKNGVHTTGTVLQVLQKDSYGVGSPAGVGATRHYQQFTEVVQFTDQNNQKITFDAQPTTTNSQYATYEPGVTVPVLYNPAHPTNAILDDGRANGVSQILLIVGFVPLFYGLYLIISRTWKRSQSQIK